MTQTVVVLVMLTAVLATGCNWLLPAAFLLPDKKTVPPEYAGLKDTKALVLIWAEPETLYDYPHIRFELANYIGDKLSAEVSGLTLTDPRKVEDFIERTPEAAYDPRLVGQHFDVQRVVYVELLQFQIRDPDAPDFLQGKIQGSVVVHSIEADPDEAQMQELDQVATVCPDHPVLFTPQAPLVVRNDTYAKFAELVARKFYAHEEAL